ncbi:MAG TPA: hypothetical protein VLA36_14470 [Longimicrobiales bacterium]|nr:hypothetical protein [Longimicrobiales bacterium]
MRSTPTWALLLCGAVLCAPVALSAQSWRTVTMSRQRSGEQDLRVHVTYGAGRFKVRSVDGGLLYRMQLRYDEDVFEPRVDFEGSSLHLGVENVGKSIRMGKNQGGEMDLVLARDLPMDLDLEFGAVRADVDLGGISMTGLHLKTGASESVVDITEPNSSSMRRASFEVGAADFTARNLGNLNARSVEVNAGVGEIELWFTGSWSQDASVDLTMGLGSLELVFPEGLGVRLTKDSFLTSVDTEGLVKRGDAYYSLDWEDAERKVTIDLNAAFGSVDVRWVR